MTWTKEQREAYKERYSKEYLNQYSRDYKRDLTIEQKKKYNATQKARRATLSQEKREAYKETARKYERTLEQRKAYYQTRLKKRLDAGITSEQIEENRRYKREWARSHPEERRVQCTLRRARKLQAEGSYTPQEWMELVELCDHTCLKCGRREPDIKLSVDHIIPISKGGSNWISNIQPLCVKCNTAKGNRNSENLISKITKKVRIKG